MSNHKALNMFGRSGNPAFGNKFSQQGSFVGTDAMSLSGTVNKTGILLGLCFLGAAIGWNVPNMALIWIGILGGLGAALYTIFVPRNAVISSPIYAFLVGLAIGAI